MNINKPELAFSGNLTPITRVNKLIQHHMAHPSWDLWDVHQQDFDGVRAHVNHICAYVGQEPIGEPHGRYHTVMGLNWAGTIKYVEELGGKYAPSITYGIELVELHCLLPKALARLPYEKFVAQSFQSLFPKLAALHFHQALHPFVE